MDKAFDAWAKNIAKRHCSACIMLSDFVFEILNILAQFYLPTKSR